MLSVHLANIKSSGIYRFTFDKSLVVDQSVETLRLVVGYSEVGPFNTAMYVTSIAQFEQLYGSGSKKLEKRGIYFHRLAKQCLSKTPIICLNLKKFENEALGMSTFNVADKPYDDSCTGFIKVEDAFDTSRLWVLSPEKLVSTMNSVMVPSDSDEDVYEDDGSPYTTKYITISSTGSEKSSCSVLFRPAKASKYDITIADWYVQTGYEMPEYLQGRENTYVSDYFVNVYVFRGNLTNPSVTLKDYFVVGDDTKIKMLDNNGNDIVDLLAKNESSGYFSTYSGVLLPYFYDLDGSNLSIDLRFNVDNSTHNLMMYLDSSYLEDGKNNISVDDLNVSGLYNSSLSTTDWTITTGSSIFGQNKFFLNTIVKEFGKDAKNNDAYISKATPGNTKFYDTADIVSYVGDDITYSDKVLTMKTTNKELSGCPIGKGDSIIIFGSGAGTLASVENAILSDDKLFVNLTIDIKNIDDAGAISDVAAVCKITRRTKLTLFNDQSQFLYLEGYKYQMDCPGTVMSQKKKWHSDILSTLTDNEGIYLALTSSSDLDYRYIIDTFEAYVEAGHGTVLAKLCKDKGNALLISNIPSMKSFADCPYTNFKDENKVFKTDYIVTGGEGGERFSLPTEANGASFAAFYTPLKFADNAQFIMVPAAGIVSNNFMDKYTSRQPYYVVAGPNYGRMMYDNLVGPDFNYSQKDRDNLEPIGINVMLYKPKRGTFINSNQTAKQVPYTALSKVNVRELVIYLQDTIATMLENYHWEMNTASLRALIKAKADAICEQVMANGGLYAYFNQCDDSNNTPEVIDNEMLVLSTHIEPAKGAGKMIHELTIYNTGEMSSYIK